MSLVLSVTPRLVPSGTPDSCHREPNLASSPWQRSLKRRANRANQESFGFLLTHAIARPAAAGRLRRGGRP